MNAISKNPPYIIYKEGYKIYAKWPVEWYVTLIFSQLSPWS